MRRGVLFSIIAARNDIENPDLIFPNQKLNIPVKK
jgi:nucleoid-associated protein YgaU